MNAFECFIGVDPGAKGGIAAIFKNFSGVQIFVHSLVDKTENEIAEAFDNILDKLPVGCDVHCLLERVHAAPGAGVSGMFKFGQSYGFLRACLVCKNIPFEEVAPIKWQTKLNCRTGGEKNITKNKAQNLFPGTKGITHATADALLIAEYLRRSKQQP